MKSDSTPASEATPPAPGASGPASGSRARVYQPPVVLWEQPFVALAQVSFTGDYGCETPGSCEDMP